MPVSANSESCRKLNVVAGRPKADQLRLGDPLNRIVLRLGDIPSLACRACHCPSRLARSGRAVCHRGLGLKSEGSEKPLPIGELVLAEQFVPFLLQGCPCLAE